MERQAGLAVFLLGVFLLLVSFILAYHLLTRAPRAAGEGTQGLLSAANAALTVLPQLLFLAAMIWAASLIADKGVKMAKGGGSEGEDAG